MKNKIKLNRAFTLVETLIAISIFTVALVGLMSVLAQNLSGTTYAEQKMTATYLAQEGIEYIRNMRDTYMLYSVDAPTGWTLFNTKIASCETSNGCYFNSDNVFSLPQPMPITQITLNACTPNCPDLSYDSTTGKYGYASGTDSGFSRKIQITQISSDELKLTSTVYWTQGSGQQGVAFSEDLFDWIQ